MVVTVDELIQINSDLVYYYANIGEHKFNNLRFATEFCLDKQSVLKELTLYQWVLNYWEQYFDGTPKENNYITQEEFNIMINRIKFIIYNR
jgi:hypothetical protein